MSENPILYKRLDAIQIAAIKAHINERGEILPLITRLRAVCGDAVQGDPLVIFHGGAVKDGFVIEAALPVSDQVQAGEVYTRMLEAEPALIKRCVGPHQGIRNVVMELNDYLVKHAWTTSLIRREVYRVLEPDHPENNVTEVQVILHEWDKLLAEGAESVLEVEARRKIMRGIETITPESSSEAYISWIEGAMARLDGLTDDEQKKYRIVSCCAHVFPQERIDHLREIYQRGTFDDVLREMYRDEFWFEKPIRRGRVLYQRKNPYDPEGYKNGVTPAERRKAYCHCDFVHPYLDEVPAKLSTTFCYCGAGWYRRLWEGVLGQPVMIELVETVLRGNDQCSLTITLPFEMEGECRPG